MSEKKPFSDPRWNDTSLPKVIGHMELTEEQKKSAKEWRERIKSRKNKSATEGVKQ